MGFNLEREGNKLTNMIKHATWFPFRSGNLKFNATSGHMVDKTTYVIHFDSTIANYVGFLEEGTSRSQKHKGFIKDKAVGTIVEYIAQNYRGDIKIL